MTTIKCMQCSVCTCHSKRSLECEQTQWQLIRFRTSNIQFMISWGLTPDVVMVVVLVLWRYHCNTMELLRGVRSTENKFKIVIICCNRLCPLSAVNLDCNTEGVWDQSVANYLCFYCTTLHELIFPDGISEEVDQAWGGEIIAIFINVYMYVILS